MVKKALCIGINSDFGGPDNFCYDARIASRSNGALTDDALKALECRLAGATWADSHAQDSNSLLGTSSPQTPRFSGSKAARGLEVLA